MERSSHFIKKVVVFGAGTMGQHIARLFSRNGIKTELYDSSAAVLDKIAEWVGDDPYLKLTTSWKDTLADADLVIESIPEVLSLKRELLYGIAPFVHARALVASNTSSFPLQTLSEGLPYAERMLLMHFFNPADIIPLVELVKPDDMDVRAADAVLALLKHCGKVPVVLKKGVKGFIANRLQAAVLREACSLVQQGVAHAEDIDTAVKMSIGLRWAIRGPFEIADYGGLDVWERVLTNLLPDLDNSPAVPQVLREHVERKELGVKTGKGFYEHQPEKDAPDWRTTLKDVLNRLT